MQLSVSICVIGSLICNQNDKLHVILTILFLQWCAQLDYLHYNITVWLCNCTAPTSKVKYITYNISSLMGLRFFFSCSTIGYKPSGVPRSNFRTPHLFSYHWLYRLVLLCYYFPSLRDYDLEQLCFCGVAVVIRYIHIQSNDQVAWKAEW